MKVSQTFVGIYYLYLLKRSCIQYVLLVVSKHKFSIKGLNLVMKILLPPVCFNHNFYINFDITFISCSKDPRKRPGYLLNVNIGTQTWKKTI